MDELLKLHDLYLLKEVERKTTVKERFESSAEHTYSCFILADYFLDLMGEKLDRGRVMQLLLYHDMVEIYAGDTFILDDTGRAEKKAKEHQALEVLKKKLPRQTAGKLDRLWTEFEEWRTPEAKFANAMDKLDPLIHCLHKKPLWKEHGFTEENLRRSKERYFAPFPELFAVFNDLVRFLRENRYFADLNE